jgi:hypothetical protein
MFSRESCYFFVRPRRKDLQVCVFLGRAIRAPQVRRVERRSATKFVHIIHITHRDEVEPPITDWLREAYDLSDTLKARRAEQSVKRNTKPTKSTAKHKSTRRRAR